MARMDNLGAMRTFVAVVDAGSFSAAARKLGVQQSTVSRTIGTFEEMYAVSVFTRSTRKMKLTEAGLVLLGESRRILAEIDDLGGRIKRIHEVPEGLLRINLSTAFGKLLVVPTLAEFKKRFPRITLEIHHDDRLVDLVAEGYDVVIRVGRSDDSLITSRRIAVVKRGLFAARTLVKKLGPIERPEDLARYPALLFGDRVPSAPKWELSKGGRRVVVPIESITVVDHLDSLFALMRAGLGLAYGPLFLAAPTMVGPPIERVLVDWEVVHRYAASTGVYALFKGGTRVSAKVRAFVDFLVQAMEVPRGSP